MLTSWKQPSATTSTPATKRGHSNVVEERESKISKLDSEDLKSWKGIQECKFYHNSSLEL